MRKTLEQRVILQLDERATRFEETITLLALFLKAKPIKKVNGKKT